MATQTLGTNAVTTLTALGPLTHGFAGFAATDVAAIANSILNDTVNGNPIWPGAFVRENLLYIPNRGVLKILQGDFVGVDATGWPILISKNAITSGSTSWTHT